MVAGAHLLAACSGVVDGRLRLLGGREVVWRHEEPRARQVVPHLPLQHPPTATQATRRHVSAGPPSESITGQLLDASQLAVCLTAGVGCAFNGERKPAPAVLDSLTSGRLRPCTATSRLSVFTSHTLPGLPPVPLLLHTCHAHQTGPQGQKGANMARWSSEMLLLLPWPCCCRTYLPWLHAGGHGPPLGLDTHQQTDTSRP